MIYRLSRGPCDRRSLILGIFLIYWCAGAVAAVHDGTADGMHGVTAAEAPAMPHATAAHSGMNMASAAAETPAVEFKTFDRDQAYNYSQQVIGSRVSNYHFLDSDGNSVSLDDFSGQPLIISLIYTSCYHICPTTTQYLSSVVRQARSAMPEKEFTVLSVGFDTRVDSPQAMRDFSRKQGAADKGWYFLSADEQTVQALAKELGFIFYPAPQGFNHLVQASVLKADRTVYRQVYGMKFEIPLLIEPLKDLLFNRPMTNSLSQSLSDKIRFFCTVYDPASDRYRFDYSIFIGMFIGIMSCLVLGMQLIKEWRRTVRKAS